MTPKDPLSEQHGARGTGRKERRLGGRLFMFHQSVRLMAGKRGGKATIKIDRSAFLLAPLLPRRRRLQEAGEGERHSKAG